jgi:dienelactone hydrolase
MRKLKHCDHHCCQYICPVSKPSQLPIPSTRLLHPFLTPSLDVTGPKDAKRGILIVYDIFGFFNQTLQGADILAYSDSEHPYQVFIPNFFEGEPADISWYPPDNKEKEKKLGEFFKTKAAPPKTLPRIPKIVKEASEKRGVETWGIMGFCWGGKVCYLFPDSSACLGDFVSD